MTNGGIAGVKVCCRIIAMSYIKKEISVLLKRSSLQSPRFDIWLFLVSCHVKFDEIRDCHSAILGALIFLSTNTKVMYWAVITIHKIGTRCKLIFFILSLLHSSFLLFLYIVLVASQGTTWSEISRYQVKPTWKRFIIEWEVPTMHLSCTKMHTYMWMATLRNHPLMH